MPRESAPPEAVAEKNGKNVVSNGHSAAAVKQRQKPGKNFSAAKKKRATAYRSVPGTVCRAPQGAGRPPGPRAAAPTPHAASHRRRPGAAGKKATDGRRAALPTAVTGRYWIKQYRYV